MFKKDSKAAGEDRVINITAGIKGELKFNSPINLRISGKFEGELETKGTLTIGEKADIKARIIKGENIIIYGKVKGDIVCSKRLEILKPAKVVGDIKTPVLIITEGIVLNGHCQVAMEDDLPANSRKAEHKGKPKKRKGKR